MITTLLICAALSSHPAELPKRLRGHLNLTQSKSEGLASWYGKREQGRKMANGKPFDRNRYTAASRTYKLGTVLLVSYPSKRTFVRVVVTDRGPWIKGRILDLSERAAQTLGLKPYGVGRVLIELEHLSACGQNIQFRKREFQEPRIFPLTTAQIYESIDRRL